MDQRTIRIKVSFDGTNYAGWQRQKNDQTIQRTLEDSIGIMTGEQVVVHGAGRTDAGVHALGMVAHFNTVATIQAPGFQRGLNSMLPADIRILALQDVESSFHARFSARSKTYIYKFDTSSVQTPTERLYATHFCYPLDIEKMKTCLHALLGSHDFSCFEASGSRDKEALHGRGAVRQLLQAELFQDEGKDSKYWFEFTGDGFLRRMVRNLVGTLLEVGSNKRSVEDFVSLLEGGDRCAAGPTAPAHGLFLQEVHY